MVQNEATDEEEEVNPFLNHPLHEIRDEKGRKAISSHNDPLFLAKIGTHLKGIAEAKCKNVVGGFQTKCDCLEVFKSEDVVRECSVLVLHFGLKNWNEQHLEVTQAMYHSKGVKKADRKWRIWKNKKEKRKTCILPGIFVGKNSIFLCENGFCHVFGVGSTFKRTVDDHIRTKKPWDPPIVHGHTGKAPNSSKTKENQEANEAVNKFIKKMADEYGEYHATRYCREATGLQTRDDDVNRVELPANFTKRRLYYLHCYECGRVVPTATAKGNLGSTKDYKYRDLGPDEEYISVVSFATFLKIWEENFSNVVVRPKVSDTCDICVQLKNEHRSLQEGDRLKKKIAELEAELESLKADDDIDDLVIGELISERKQELQLQSEIEGCEEKLVRIEAVSESEEAWMKSASDHISGAQSSRNYCNKKIELAQEDAKDEALLHWQKVHTIVMDYCQNLECPFTGEEQAGKTYYLSPLFAYLFGIVNAADQRLHAYCYPEGAGAKGGNNVVSLLHKYLVNSGFCKKGVCGKELNIIADNCSGQNKNKTVIRYCGWLVEMGFFKQVNLAFLVKGHTKNICDRKFNLLKVHYRNTNIFTYAALMESIDTAESVTAVSAVPSDFQDWNGFFDQFYKPSIESGTVMENHLFTFSYMQARGRRMLYRRYPGIGEEMTQMMTMISITNKLDGSSLDVEIREDGMQAAYYETVLSADKYGAKNECPYEFREELVPPGYSPLKKCELWEKWALLFDKIEWEDGWAKFVPKPTKEEKDKVKGDRKKRKKARALERQVAGREEEEVSDASGAEAEAVEEAPAVPATPPRGTTRSIGARSPAKGTPSRDANGMARSRKKSKKQGRRKK